MPTAFETALAAKKGEIPAEELRGAAKKVFDTLSEEEIQRAILPRSAPSAGAVFLRSTKRNFKVT